MRATGWVAAAVLVAGGLAGCGPDDSDRVAVMLRNGVPTILYYSCGGHVSVTVGDVLDPTDPPSGGLFGPVSGATPSPVPPQPDWRMESVAAFEGLRELPVLGPPPEGWRYAPDGGRPPARLRPGVKYIVTGATPVTEMIFTAEDLAELPAGTALEPGGQDRQDMPPTPEQFAARAEADCPRFG
jgi:hypothetical protein